MKADMPHRTDIPFFCVGIKGQRVLYLKLGVGANTPVIIKYPFWKMTARNPKTSYVCINYQEAYAPREIWDATLCIENDIGEVLNDVCLIFLTKTATDGKNVCVTVNLAYLGGFRKKPLLPTDFW